MIIVFQNENLVVVDKPAAVLTTPSRDPRDPRPCLGRDLQSRMDRRIWPVHRLDFDVGGLVIFALNPEAHTRSQSWFEHGQVGKFYEAIAAAGPIVDIGVEPDQWREWSCPIVRGKRRSFVADHGVRAVTRARVMDPTRNLWELQPVTGRPHQLRVHMARFASPIVGDRLYGWAGEFAGTGIALRAVRLDFSRIDDRLGLPEFLTVKGLGS